LNRSAEGAHASEYHLEAGIAMLHCTAAYKATDWPTVLRYYDLLLARNLSPVVALHRAIALAHVEGPAAALAEEVALGGLDQNQY
jgi:RNA polymerase sigma-70 factor (ECF subfamily)